MSKNKKPDWPKELNNPIIITPFAGPALPFGSLIPPAVTFDDKLRAERQLRIDIIAKHLQMEPPKTWDEEWVKFTAAICKHWKIPGLQEPTEKQSRAEWTDEKLCGLFADVCWVKKHNPRLRDLGACKHIAARSNEFGGRYSFDHEKPDKAQINSWASTLNRKLSNFKEKIKQSEFRHTHFGSSTGLGELNKHTPQIGPDLCKIAIERYASNSPPEVA
jgi:hypothetical protein